MTVVARTLAETAAIPAAQTTLYTAPANTRAIIDKMTATNTTAAAVTLSINIVVSAGTAGTANLVASAQSIAAGASYLCPEVVGHVLSAGDFVSVLPSAAGVNIRMSGREVA